MRSKTIHPASLFRLKRNWVARICTRKSDSDKRILPGNLGHLREAVRSKRRDLWKAGVVIMTNASTHSSLIIGDFLAKHYIPPFRQPLYSPDMAPADFSLFTQIKHQLHWRSTLSEPRDRRARCKYWFIAKKLNFVKRPLDHVIQQPLNEPIRKINNWVWIHSKQGLKLLDVDFHDPTEIIFWFRDKVGCFLDTPCIHVFVLNVYHTIPGIIGLHTALKSISNVFSEHALVRFS